MCPVVAAAAVAAVVAAAVAAAVVAALADVDPVYMKQRRTWVPSVSNHRLFF